MKQRVVLDLHGFRRVISLPLPLPKTVIYDVPMRLRARGGEEEPVSGVMTRAVTFRRGNDPGRPRYICVACGLCE